MESLSGFLLASVLLILAPGPDNLYVIATAARQGFLMALWLTVGLCCGLLFHTLAVILGVAVLIKTTPLAFTLLKTAGAVYLLFLAWQLLRAPAALPSQQSSPTLYSRLALFLRGVVMNVSNPKVGLFFLAFLPQFVLSGPQYQHAHLQILVLGLMFLSLAFVLFATLAWIASHESLKVQFPEKLKRWLNWLLAGTFVYLALRLLFSHAV